MSRRQKYARNWLPLLLAAILLGICAAGALVILARDGIPAAPAPPEPSESGINETLPVQTLQGTLTDATMNTLTVQAVDGSSYTFGTEGVELATGEDGLLIGEAVTITYRGDRSDFKLENYHFNELTYDEKITNLVFILLLHPLRYGAKYGIGNGGR